MKDVDEDDDEEEAAVLGDVGCAAMRAGAGSMEGVSSGRGLGWVAGGPQP